MKEGIVVQWRRALRKAAGAPGVPQARHVAERAVAPYLRADLHTLGLDHAATVERLSALEIKVEGMAAGVSALEAHMPAVLNAIASAAGTARLLRRDFESLVGEPLQRATETAAQAHRSIAEVYDHIRRLETAIQQGDQNVLAEIRPHLDTLRWLVSRVEVVRAEAMNEIRYGTRSHREELPIQVLNPEALHVPDVRVNLGAGHLPIDGYVNVDMRELPGIDVVAAVDSLPFEPGTVAEIFSAHTLEHFPEEELRRKLLPYWHSLLRPGGVIRAVVPDLEAMTSALTRGDIPFGVFRNVAYGGQEYEGDFHYTGFTPTSLSALLAECGFVDTEVLATGRTNGDCLECEVAARRPAN